MGFKKDEITGNADVTNDDNDPPFKYKTGINKNVKAIWTQNGEKITYQ